MAARYEKAIADTQALRNTIADFEKKGYPMQFANTVSMVDRAVYGRKAREVAAQLGFKGEIILGEGDADFEVNGHQYHTGGQALLNEGKILVYPDRVPLEVMPNLMAHEVMHHKWHKVYTTYVQEGEKFERYQRMFGGTDNKPSLKSYPTYAAIRPFLNTKITYKLDKEDGCSDYSKDYWKGWSDGNNSYTAAVHETLAELARLDYESNGTYFRRLPQSTSPWRKFYEAVNKSYERLSKNDN
jgi:hypothetical protein